MDDPRASIARLKEVGRYALGVEWGDGHESILPYRNIRQACPCEACATGGDTPPARAEPAQPASIEVLGGASLFLRFADGHETILLTEELRALCRCARCIPEPEYPVSGQ